MKTLFAILVALIPVLSVAQTSVPWGSIPSGWDDFKVGLVNDNSNIINVRMKKALSEGVNLHYRYAYVNNGVDPNSNALSWLFNQWGTDYSQNSSDMGLRPSYVIYMLQEEGGVAALKANIQNQDFMRKYFTSIRIVSEKSNGYKAIFVIEPDTWGYFLQNALEQGTESNPNNIPATVNNLGAGYEYLSDLPNTMSGVAKAIIRTIRRYAPDAYCGHLMNFWAVAANGVTGPPVPDGAKGMVYWNQSDVDYAANRAADFGLQLLGSSGDRGDFIGVEKNGWSAGNWLVKQNRNDYYWNDTQNAKWLSWSKTMAQKVNLPLLGWQISIGHIGLPNTVNRYEDTFMPYFFTHVQDFMNAGFIGFLAGKGLADCTDFTNANGNELEADGSAGDDGWFFERLKEFDNGRPYLNSVNNPAPTVSISSPSNGASFVSPVNITINATANDSDGTITKVEFYNGTTKLGEDISSPYSYTWNNVAQGSYSITAKATDNAGATGTSAAVSITVTGGSTCTTPAWNSTSVYTKDMEVSKDGNKYQAKWWTQNNDPVTNSCTDCVWKLIGPCGGTTNASPSVSLTAPANNSTYTTPASITISASASDTDGTISKVEFFNGSTKLGEDTNSPYSYTWNNVAAGSYSITAKATDNAGGTGTSSARTVTVNGNTSNTPPTVSLSAPSNGATYTAPASIAISASASDSDGSVTQVAFYNGSTLLGTDNSSPYSYSWTNVAAGTYTITARATDDDGATTISASRSVTVNGNTGTCSGKPNYVENGGYVAGSQVQNNGSLYECKPYPYSGWCNGASWAYGPGTGSYWSDAWTLLGSCSGARLAAPEVSSTELSVYPNPNFGGNVLNIDLDDLYEDVKISIQSVDGGKTYTYRFKNTRSIEIVLPELSKGLKILKVKAGRKTWAKKIIN